MPLASLPAAALSASRSIQVTDSSPADSQSIATAQRTSLNFDHYIFRFRRSAVSVVKMNGRQNSSTSSNISGNNDNMLEDMIRIEKA